MFKIAFQKDGPIFYSVKALLKIGGRRRSGVEAATIPVEEAISSSIYEEPKKGFFFWFLNTFLSADLVVVVHKIAGSVGSFSTVKTADQLRGVLMCFDIKYSYNRK